MKDLTATALRYQDGQLFVLDQRCLPDQEIWHHCQDTQQLIVLIQSLAIRGAPLIGIAAALWVAHESLKGVNTVQLYEIIERLRAARPTAVNLNNYLNCMAAQLAAGGASVELVAQAEQIFAQDVQLCDLMASNGAALISKGARILTHCNTGSLATAGVGTALGVIAKCHKLDKGIHVWVDETRPLLQGGRLTAWELTKLGVPFHLICDNMAASLMAEGKVDAVVVGADRIAINGDFANKVGTYGLAVLAFYHEIPFYVVAPHTTIDVHCPDGTSIPIEQRDPSEVRGVNGSFGSVQWAPGQSPVHNPAFDVTPASLVTGWVLDGGVFTSTNDWAVYIDKFVTQ